MRLVIIILILCVRLQVSWSQGFNLVQDYGYPVNHFTDMIVANDTIVGLGVAYPDSFNLTQAAFLVKMDSNGNVIKTKLIFGSNGDHLVIATPSYKLTKTMDGGYAFFAASSLNDNAFFFKLDVDLEEEFRYEFIDSINLASFNMRLLETKAGYIIYGHVRKPNFGAVGVIKYIDKNCHIIWSKEYSQGGIDNYVMNINAINDSSFVACSIVESNSDLFYGYSAIRTFNINGEQLGYWQSAVDSETGYLLNIRPTTDNGFIAYGNHLHHRLQNSYYVEPSFTKFDSNFNIEWIRHWGRPTFTESATRMVDTYLTEDGNYLSIGRIAGVPDENYIYRVKSWFMKYSPEGDSIWSREVDTPSFLGQTYGGAIYGSGVLSSGSVIGGGAALHINAYFGWIVKLTRDGCLDTLFVCPETSSVHTPLEKGDMYNLQLYPNPTTGVVSWNGGDGGAYRVRVFNQLGQLVAERQATANTLFIGDLQEGMYQLRFLTSKGELITTKSVFIVH